MIDDLADDEQEKLIRDELREQRDAEDLRWLMDHEQGRRFLWKLLERSGYLDVCETLDPQELACIQGSRAIGRFFFDQAMAIDATILARLMADDQNDPLA